MDRMRNPLHSGPMFPIGSRWQLHDERNHLHGTIVGVRSGRTEDAETTRILTIKLTEAQTNLDTLLHAEVELIVSSKP
jgi:hypothetical protein